MFLYKVYVDMKKKCTHVLGVFIRSTLRCGEWFWSTTKTKKKQRYHYLKMKVMLIIQLLYKLKNHFMSRRLRLAPVQFTRMSE